MNHDDHGGPNFAISYYSPSLASSRSASPTPSLSDADVPGNLHMGLYEATLPRWRAGPRRFLVQLVQHESRIIAKMQDKIRTPWLDTYFVYTSSLGTHTFFMITLPACFWFGYNELAIGLLSALSIGVYCSSVVKDLFCSPRPFSPPVTRLTMGSHHLEYGFPSTHSTNSISIALLLFAFVYDLAYPPSPSLSPTISSTTFIILSLILSIYAFSIVFGRLYTAMHSFTDCLFGVILGTAIWWVSTSWNGIPIALSPSNPLSSLTTNNTLHLGRGLGIETHLWNWVATGGWEVPLILVPLCLLLVHQHPQPVDDCPCFEDAIAFASVFFGALVGRWVMMHCDGLRVLLEGASVMPGSGWVWDLAGAGRWQRVERGWMDDVVWWSVAGIKMTLGKYNISTSSFINLPPLLGIMVIFTWRLLAKSALHLILPPTFRFLARSFRLPNRRFYTPATEYESVPSEFGVTKAGGLGVLHPIPSVIDLPSGGAGVSSGREWRDVKMRVVGGEKGVGRGVRFEDAEEEEEEEKVRHYDADVLTKVIVYAGIAFISTELIPASFGLLGLGLKSWP